MYYVYIVECRDGSLYTGWTVDLDKRIARHNEGKGAKYTRARQPVVLRYSEEAADKSEACKKEYMIKLLSRSDKLKLINENQSE